MNPQQYQSPNPSMKKPVTVKEEVISLRQTVRILEAQVNELLTWKNTFTNQYQEDKNQAVMSPGSYHTFGAQGTIQPSVNGGIVSVADAMAQNKNVFKKNMFQ